jgi:hypothetical protein
VSRDTVWSQPPLLSFKEAASRFSEAQTVVERSHPLLKFIPTITPGSKDRLGAMMIEVGALAALAAVMMIAGFKVILSGLSG